jgi:hypothetical protein
MKLLRALWVILTLLVRPKRRALVSELMRRQDEKVDRLKNPSNYGPDSPDRPANVSEKISRQADAIETACEILAQREELIAEHRKAKEQGESPD